MLVALDYRGNQPDVPFADAYAKAKRPRADDELAMPHPRKLVAVELREGRPGHRPVVEGLRLAPKPPPEPNWSETFPPGGTRSSTNARARRIARDFWRRVVSILDPQGIVSELDFAALERASVLWARIDEAERICSREGLTRVTERGVARHPATTVANQSTEKLLRLLADLGMTPAARDRLNPRERSEHDPDFDDI
ncbi:MAG: phage terminase small subunit P27 family [Actinomycetota bacterium]|nr:phage terminase small subunit P27 family [Actinomycetota bacterium]